MSMLSIGIILSSCGNKTTAINGYEWLEGEWEGCSEYGDWGKIIITPTTYKIVYNYTNDNPEEIAIAEEQTIDITQMDSYILGSEIIALDKDNPLIGIDVPNQRVYIIMGEYNCLYLENPNKLVKDIAEDDNSSDVSKESIPQESNVPTALNFTKSYGWEEDNLKGRVKCVEETFQSQEGSSWFIRKEYDSLGRICYFKRDGSDANVLSTVLPKGFPNPNKMGGINSSAHEEYGRYLNPIHMLGYNASSDKRHFTEETFTFDYNDKGLISNVYSDNRLINRYEYDEYNRLTIRYENDQPTLKIIWGENAESTTRTPFEIRLYRIDGSLLKTLTGIWTRNILKIENGGANPKEYTFVGDELRDYKANYNAYGYQYEYYTLSNTNNTLEISEHIGYDIIYHTYKYNEEGYLSEYIAKKDDRFISYFKWDYKYDDNQNWTEATKYKVTVGKDITFEEELDAIIRKYEYYE